MTGRLSAHDLAVRLGGRVILDGLSLVLEPGRVTCVVGPNGAGKSTLLACLTGLRRPDGGEARIDAAPVLGLAPRIRARRIGFLPQTPEIAWAIEAEVLVGLGRTPYAAGFGGPNAADRAAIERAIALTEVGHLARRTVDTLSGGERARVLIARALAGEPEWLLADEPLAGLDPGHQIDACDLFRRLAHEEGRGVVLTLHDLPMAFRVADRVLVLADGRMIADGPPSEALSPEVLRQAYGVEARLVDGAHGPLLELVGRSGA
jgi:iron complex transport system ATP-binding protein